MATVPRRGSFTKRKRRFSYVGKYDPSLSHPVPNGNETEDYSSAEEVDIDTMNPRQVALDARLEEENRTILEKTIQKAKEDEAKSRTVKARVLDTARRVVNTVSPRKPATFTFKRRGELGGRGVKKHTKKQVKRARNHKQNKTTKRQPKRRN